MKANFWVRVSIVVVLVAFVVPGAQAAIISSVGSATLTHTASFDGGPAVVQGGVPAAIPPTLVHNSVINGVGGDNSTASGGVNQTFNWGGPDSHLVFLPAGFDIWVDDSNDSLDAFGLGNPSATFRLDFNVNFLLAGGMGVVNTFANFPFVGDAPVGYQVDLAVSGTWTDLTTDGDPILPQSTLSNAAVFSESGPFAGALLDAGAWGGFAANLNDAFNLSGFLEINISKKIGAAPGIVGAGLIDQTAIDAGVVPEPSSLFFAGLCGIGVVTTARRRRA